jgi:Carboxypeptidase regulatory-like domain
MLGTPRTLQIGLKSVLSVIFIVSCVLPFSHSALGQGGATLSGVVSYNGSIMPRFPVSLYSFSQVLQTETDQAGRFEFTDLPPGTYDLQASYLGVEGAIYGVRVDDKNIGPLTLSANLVQVLYPLDLDCGHNFWVAYKEDDTAGGHLSGSLLLEPEVSLSNSGLAEVRIDLIAADKRQHKISQQLDENGKFEFKNVNPGRYTLFANRAGYWKVQSTIWIAQKDVTAVKIILYKHGHPAICE